MSSSSDGAGTAANGGGRLLVDEPAPGVARLTISNPQRRGALDHPILDALAATVPALDARCVIVTGEGATFSAGYDLAGLPDGILAEEADRLVAHPFAAALDAIEAYPYPTLAVLNGHAIGGGLELALACDLRIAASSIKLGMPPAKLGLVYSHTGIRKFIDAIGVARTRELFLVGRRIDATTAAAWGLVNFVHDDADLIESSLGLATRDGRERADRAARQQAGDRGGDGGAVLARGRRRVRGAGAAHGLPHLRGLSRGRRGLHPEARASLAGAVSGAMSGRRPRGPASVAGASGLALALLLTAAALATGAAFAAPASAASASVYQRVLRVYEQDGSLPSCMFSSAQLESALGDVDTYGAQYFADFTQAMQAALQARASGDCSARARMQSGGGTRVAPGKLPTSVTSATDASWPGALVVMGVIALVAALLGGASALLRATGMEPRWLLAWRHAWAEAEYRLGARLARLRDTVR